MSERIVYMNGEYIAESQAKISIFDHSFYFGDAVYDTSRTVRHKPYKFKEHIERLYRSLRYLRINPRMTPQEMLAATEEVVRRNVPLLAENDDYWVIQNVSRGLIEPGVTRSPTAGGRPTVVIFCEAISFKTFASRFTEGVKLFTPSTRRTPPQCLDPKVKTRNYLNHMLAELEAKEVNPEYTALMLDLEGNITEHINSNFFIVADGGLVTPGPKNVLCGISRQTVMVLAVELGIPVRERDIQVYDALNADEAFITSTSCCIAPVSMINGVCIGNGKVPGPITKRLTDAWSEAIGLDIVGQFLSRR